MFLVERFQMSEFFGRLRNALLPEYELLQELGSGGMGTVFLVKDVALAALQAVKVLHPELWTAESDRQFVGEAQILADLRHPHIVPVHNVDVRDGLTFYVMDYLEGETLQSHLEKHGRLAVDAARKFGRDLLDALGKAHRKGVIHRDVKPSNVFLGPDGAVLTDFGIARRPTSLERTDPRILRGTAAYMAPEQFAGLEADVRTDLYSAAMVIYEAFTGVRWAKTPAAKGDWSGIPGNIARVLRRALQLDRTDRWPDADTFRRALWRTREWRYQRRTVLLTAGGLVAGAAMVMFLGSRVIGFFRSGSRIQIDRLAFSGAPAANSWLGDSIACSLTAALAHFPDLEIRGPCDPPWGRLRRRTVLEGTVYSSGATVQAILGPWHGPWTVASSFNAASWHEGVDNLASVVFDSLLGGSRFLELTLPRSILPKNPIAWKGFLDGEHNFAQAKWGEAYGAYGAAAATDSSCWMCYWRHAEVGRWLGLSQDTADVLPYRRAIDLFPEHYRRLIAAESLPLGKRLEGFGDVARRWPEFMFGRFRYADESFHRGPLIGRARRQSIALFNDVVRNGRIDFGPAWEHLAWAAIAESDSAQAESAIDSLRAIGPVRDPSTVQIRALIEAAFACRFFDADRCRRVLIGQLKGAEAAGVATIDAGARWLPYFDAQAGAIELGRILAGRPQLARSALIAQAFGTFGLGHVDSARALLRRTAERFGDSSLDLFVDELDAVLAAFDPDSARLAGYPAVAASLAERAALPTTPTDERIRAAWMLDVASYQLGRPEDATVARQVLGGEPRSTTLDRLATAIQAARHHDMNTALSLSEPLTELEADGSEPDPFFRTVLHLFRAEWYQRMAETEGARRELVWYQNSDVFRYPVDRPQLAEVDWAFGPFARWKIAQLASGEDACRASRDVARLWATGDVLYRARADSATRLYARMGCRETP
jgi:hypothetical protein